MSTSIFARVVTDGLHIRVMAHPDARWRTKLSRGDVVEILQLDDVNEPSKKWHKVRVDHKLNGNIDDDGKEGYAWGPGLSLIRVTPMPDPAPPPPVPPPPPDIHPVPPKQEGKKEEPNANIVIAVAIGVIVIVALAFSWLVSI